MDDGELRAFFDRLATGDYHGLAKELNISGRPLSRPSVPVTPTPKAIEPYGEISLDSFDSLTFEPTVEGLERAVSLLHGPSSPTRQTPEQEEAFQFTFRLMIHKLYSIRDFAKMVDDVVRTSQARFQSLPATPARRRTLRSSSFAYPSDNESFMSSESLASPSEATLPSSPSLRSVDQASELGREQDADTRALKKRCIGRKLSVVDTDGEGDESTGPAWVYESAEALMSSPSYAAFVAGLPPLSPTPDSPSPYGYDESSSRKRRYSLLAARGF